MVSAENVYIFAFQILKISERIISDQVAHEHPREDNSDLCYWAEITGLHKYLTDTKEKQIYVENRRVSFMYFIVDKSIFLLSARFMVWCPYRYRCDWFPK